jgi:DNA polymerase III subunit epsilon
VRSGVELGSCFPTGRHYPGIAHLLKIVAVGLANEYDAAVPLSELPLVAIDTELTGRDATVDRIVEIAAVLWKDGEVVERHSWLVNPGRPIPKEAFDVHGIGDEQVANEPAFAAVAEQILERVAGSVPVAYNADFDRAVLAAELARANHLGSSLPPAARKGVAWIDPLVWARELQKLEKSRALGEVCARLGIELARAHRAVDDAEATLRVLAAFTSDVRVPKTYGAFITEQRRLARLHDEDRRFWNRPTAIA